MDGVGKNTGQKYSPETTDTSSDLESSDGAYAIPAKKQKLNKDSKVVEKGLLTRDASPTSSDTYTQKATQGTSDTATSEAFMPGFPNISESILEPVMDVAQHIFGGNFNTRMFLTGLGEEQRIQVAMLADWLVQNLGGSLGESLNSDLRNLLDELKAAETDRNDARRLEPYNFALRSAILLASEKVGAGLSSLDVYTKQTPDGKPLGKKEFWPWVEKLSNWVPEAQAVALKYVETAFVSAKRLSDEHPEKQVVAYKGGFGAGKTSHGKETFGFDDSEIPLFTGSIASDRAKQSVRRTMPVSHNTVHTQGSNMAYNLFDSLIKLQSLGTIVYDTSLSRADDVKDMVKRSEAAAKNLKVVDISRDDKARMLAVLARSVDGEDPRIPVEDLLIGASRDRVQRPACMNVVLESQKKELPDPDNKERTRPVSHSYELYCGDDKGGDRQKVVTLGSEGRLEWKLTEQERNHRLRLQGISFNTQTRRFECAVAEEDWHSHMTTELAKPVCELVAGLSDGEKAIREKQLTARTLGFIRPAADASLESLYDSLSLEITMAISLVDFQESFSVLSSDDQSALQATMLDISKSYGALSYMDLPAAFALELNSRLNDIPESWRAIG